MPMEFTVQGLEPMQRRLLALADQNPQRVGKALYRVAEKVMTESKKVAPVDLGTLMNSGTVEQPSYGDGNVEVQLHYGGAAAPYALAVHEHPSEHSPPSWEGKTVNWQRPGSGSKFLERPLMNAGETMIDELARILNLDAGEGD